MNKLKHRKHLLVLAKRRREANRLANLSAHDREELAKFMAYLQDADELGEEQAKKKHAEYLGLPPTNWDFMKNEPVEMLDESRIDKPTLPN